MQLVAAYSERIRVKTLCDRLGMTLEEWSKLPASTAASLFEIDAAFIAHHTTPAKP